MSEWTKQERQAIAAYIRKDMIPLAEEVYLQAWLDTLARGLETDDEQ